LESSERLPSDEELKAYVWSQGDLDYLLRPHQDRIEKAFIDSPERVFVEEIGRQVGKTFWNIKKAVETCLIIPQGRVKYASAFLTSVEEYAVPTFRKILNDCPESIRPKWLESKRKAVFKNGSELKLLGLDRDKDAGRGPYCDLYIIDEAGFVKNLQDVIDSIILPMFNTRPWGRIILSSSTPESPAHPFIGFADKYEILNSYILMTIDDNKELSVERINEIKSEYTSQTAMLRELYCKRIVESTRAIIPEFQESFVEDVQPDEFRQFYHNYVFMDLGVKRDYTAGLLCYYDFLRAALIVEDEFGMMGPDMTTERLAAMIHEKEKIWDTVGPIQTKGKVWKRVADNNNPLLVQDLGATYGLPFIGTDKSRLVSMVNAVRIWVQHGRVIVHPRCKNLRGCLRSGIWDEPRREFDHSIAFGHFDWLAALVYGVRNVDTITNPIPITYGYNLLSPNTLVIHPPKKTLLKRFGE
jgi:hypothetical protein